LTTIASENGVSYRPAHPRDAEQICSLYLTAYAPSSGEDPRNFYPFPQFMDPEWLSARITRRSGLWLVADISGEIVGVVGARSNVGKPPDKLSEYFGLVVAHDFQRRGIGTKLFWALCTQLQETSDFMLAETRTAQPGGWLTVTRQGFKPIGFEPFAHTTPAGSEAMLPLAMLSDQAITTRCMDGTCSPSVRRLADVVLKSWDGKPLSSETTPALTVDKTAFGERQPIRTNVSPRMVSFKRDIRNHLKSQTGRNPKNAQRLGVDNNYGSSGSSIHLKHINAHNVDSNRFAKRSVIIESTHDLISISQLVYDARDKRATVNYLYTFDHELQGIAINEVLEISTRLAEHHPYSMVIDVRADNAMVHATLEHLGFFPTVYYPSFIAGRHGRLDAVQFTYIHMHDFEDSLANVVDLNWGAAIDVLNVVKDLAAEAQARQTEETEKLRRIAQ